MFRNNSQATEVKNTVFQWPSKQCVQQIAQHIAFHPIMSTSYAEQYEQQTGKIRAFDFTFEI